VNHSKNISVSFLKDAVFLNKTIKNKQSLNCCGKNSVKHHHVRDNSESNY